MLFPAAAADAPTKSCDNQCTYCGKYYKTPKTLRIHKLYHSEPKCVCSICKKIFHNPIVLGAHRRKEHCSKDYKCQLCESDFQFLRQLDKHLVTKHAPKRFKCEFENCDKTYSSRSGLTYHKLVHTGLKPYTCEVCGKSFITKGKLKVHTDIHSGEVHTDIHSGEVHTDIHSGVKKYKCDICERCFTQKTGLDIHLRFHTEEHKATLVRPANSIDRRHK